MDGQQSKRVGTPQDDVDPVSSVGNLAARMKSQNQGARGVDAQISQCGRGPLGKWGFPRFRSVKETQVNVDFIRWEIPPQALDWARTMENQRKVPRAGENCLVRTRTQERRRSVFGSLNHGADAEGLAMAVHSIPMVVVVPATSDRESIPFGRGFTLKDPQAAGGQCSGSGKVVFIDGPAGEGNFGGDVGSRFN